jgi:DNA replication protein DnaC
MCYGVGYLSRDVPVGHPDFGKIVACECRQAQAAEARQAQLGQLSNLLPYELKIRLEHLDLEGRGPGTREMLRAAWEFLEAPYGMLTLWGPPGNGKTTVLMGLVNELNERCFGQAAYYRLAELMEVIRRGSGPKAERPAADLYRRLKALPYLAIDEVDRQTLAGCAHEFRSLFFDDRYRLARQGAAHTLVALNEDPAVLPEAIYDRLRWGSQAPGGFRIVWNEDASARGRCQG